jgi:predicted outer membrane protein
MARAPLAAVVCALAGTAACQDTSNQRVVTTDPVMETVADGHVRGNALATHAFDELAGNDYQIRVGKTASILGALNDGEILQATFVVDRLTQSYALDLANLLIGEHVDANRRLDEVVRAYGTGYIPSTAADALTLEATAGIGRLRAAEPSELDFRYIELQVVMHAQAQVLLNELFSLVGEGEMGDYILGMKDMIDTHLTEATGLLALYY